MKRQSLPGVGSCFVALLSDLWDQYMFAQLARLTALALGRFEDVKDWEARSLCCGPSLSRDPKNAVHPHVADKTRTGLMRQASPYICAQDPYEFNTPFSSLQDYCNHETCVRPV